MKYSDANKTSKNIIKISRDQYRPVSLEPVYSQFGARLSSPHNRIRSDAAHGAQPSQNVRINNIYIAKSISGSEDNTIATLSSTPCSIISIPKYNQGPENGPHDPTIGTGTCQCAAGLSQINAALNRLSNFKDSNPQIDLNHLYHCFPIGSADNINGVPGDPRGAPFPDPNKSDAQICEYILRTISSGKCFPVKVQCNTSDVASKTQGPDCEDQTCIKWIKLKNVSKPPKAPTLADIKKQLCEGKPINVTLSGKLLDDIIHDNNTGNYQPGVNQYIWPGSGGHGFGNHAHAVVIIGFTQTETSLVLHCQNSWGNILSRIDIVIPLDKLDEALGTSVSIGNSNDANNPTLWDFDVVDCDWFPSPISAECCSGVCCLPDGTCTTDYATKEECEASDISGTWRTDIAECDECVCKACPCDGTPAEVTLSVSGTEINHPLLFCAPWNLSESSTQLKGWDGGQIGHSFVGASPAFIADGCEQDITSNGGYFRGSFSLGASITCSKVNGQAVYSMCAVGHIVLASSSMGGISSSYSGCQSCDASGGSITLSPVAANANVDCDVTFTISVTNNPLP